MKLPVNGLMTPVYLKTSAEMPWPEEAVFYLLTADGLFLCRNHRFFHSTVPAPVWPSELAPHKSSLQVHYPKITRRQMRRIVAFFAFVGKHRSAEAIVLLGWNQRTGRVNLIVPRQVATVGCNRWGETWPIGVDYRRPAGLNRDVTIFGDVHSHVDGPAYASGIDRDDEMHLPGLHIVIGRVFRHRPDFFVQAVVDGMRFDLPLDHVLKDYYGPARWFPTSWLKCVWIQRPGEQPRAAWPKGKIRSQQQKENAYASQPDDARKESSVLGSCDSQPSESSELHQENQENSANFDSQPDGSVEARRPDDDRTCHDAMLDGLGESDEGPEANPAEPGRSQVSKQMIDDKIRLGEVDKEQADGDKNESPA